MYATVYHEEIGKSISSSNFYVIRLDPDKGFLSEYVALYLNSLVNTAMFQSNFVTGVAIKMVKKSTLM
jgi:hypothetical protein